MTNIFESFENLSAQIELDAIARSVECNVDAFESVESVATELYHHDRGLGMESIYTPYMSAEDDADGAKEGAAKQGIFKRIVAAIKAFFMKIINFIKSVWRKFWGLFAKKKLKEAVEVVVEDDTALLFKGYKTYKEAVENEGEDKVAPFVIRMSMFYKMFNQGTITQVISDFDSILGALRSYSDLGKELIKKEAEGKSGEKAVNREMSKYKEAVKRNMRVTSKSTESLSKYVAEAYKGLNEVITSTSLDELNKGVAKISEGLIQIGREEGQDMIDRDLDKVLNDTDPNDRDKQFWRSFDAVRKKAMKEMEKGFKSSAKAATAELTDFVIISKGSGNRIKPESLNKMYSVISKLDRNGRRNMINTADKNVDKIIGVLNQLEYVSTGVNSAATAAESKGADVTAEHLRATISFVAPVTTFLNTMLSLVKKVTDSINSHDTNYSDRQKEQRDKELKIKNKNKSATSKQTVDNVSNAS